MAASAQEAEDWIVIADPYRDTAIVVVASGSDRVLRTTGQPVSVVGSEEIESVQGPDIVRVLERLPGVTATRNGGPGGFTGLRVRGAEAEQLLVLVDGVRVADTASPAGGFDFGDLLPSGIGKIELLRGANSTIWGSQAIGGVMAVESLAGDIASASIEYGGPESVYAQGLLGRSTGPLDWTVDAALFDTAGISSSAIGSERDGLRQWQAGGRAALTVFEGLHLRTSLRHIDARLELDGFPPPTYATFDDTLEYQGTRRTDAAAGIDYFGNVLELRASYSLSDTRRDSFDPSLGSGPTYATRGRDERTELRGRWQLSDQLDLHFGAEHEWSWMETLFDARTRAATTGAYTQAGFRHGRVTLNAGLRADDHDSFGSAWSFGADGAVDLGGGWRLRGSYGEGFKAPTLFQLLSDYGNVLLRPERSRGFDAGVGFGDRNIDGSYFAVSAFRRDSSDLIDFVSCFGATDGICTDRPFGTYDNIGRVRAQGVEIEGGARIADALALRGAYSYVEARNRTAGAANRGNDLARRPRHAATVSFDWSMPWTVDLGLDLRIVSRSFDDAANAVRLDGYEIVTARASVPVTEAVALFGRVENLFGEDYRTAAGYGSPGRGAYVGARARF